MWPRSMPLATCAAIASSGGSGSRRESRTDGRSQRDPVDAEGAPVLALAVPCEEVPAAVAREQPVWLDIPVARRAGMLSYEKRIRSPLRHAPAIVTSSSGSMCPPSAGSVTRCDPQRLDPLAKPRGEQSLQLHERSDGCLAHPLDARRRRGAQRDRDRDRLVVVEEHRRHRDRLAEAVAARDAGARLDGVSEPAQAIDVVAHRAGRHFETLGERRTRPIAPHLQQRKQAEESRRGFEHSPTISRIAERSVPH